MKTRENPRAVLPARGAAAQYSLGNRMVLSVYQRAIASSGKSVNSICLLNTSLPLPSSQASVAVRSGLTLSFQN